MDVFQQNKDAVKVLQHNMYAQKEWIKVHAAEFLLWSGYPEGVEDHFLEEEEKFSEQSPYRIGIWRVLARAAKTDEEKQKWIDKIMEAFVDENGKDRIHAAETLAKLKISPMSDYPEITKQAMESPIRSLALYTRWSVAFTSGSLCSDSLDSFYQLAISNKKETMDRNLAAYVIRQSGTLEEGLWSSFAHAALMEPRDSEARSSLFNAAFVTAPVETMNSKLFKQLYNEFLEYRETDDPAGQIKIADGLSEKGEIKDVPLLVSILESNINSDDEACIDVASYAAFAILKINDRSKQTKNNI